MYLERKFTIALSDLTSFDDLSNQALLSFLENMGGFHSDIAKYGLREIPENNLSWVLLNWKVEIKRRPKYGEELLVKTWVRGFNKFFSYRDFKVYDENNNIVILASSKWSLIDIKAKKIVHLTDEISDAYKPEISESAFGDIDLPRLKEDKDIEAIKGTHEIYKSMIDFNKHVHNVHYIEIANDAIPDDIYFDMNKDNFEVECKKEIKYGSKVVTCFYETDSYYTIAIKSEDESIVHAIIKYYK